jgi:hypothetical protein
MKGFGLFNRSFYKLKQVEKAASITNLSGGNIDISPFR